MRSSLDDDALPEFSEVSWRGSRAADSRKSRSSATRAKTRTSSSSKSGGKLTCQTVLAPEIDGRDLESLVAQFVANDLACVAILYALFRSQHLCTWTTGCRSLPAGKCFVSRLRILVPQPMHAMQTRSLTLTVVCVLLLDVAFVSWNQRALAGEAVCLVEHGTLFGVVIGTIRGRLPLHHDPLRAR